jgi:LDH2 family malate/lactate/ureidoglycolate dehydrogenase
MSHHDSGGEKVRLSIGAAKGVGASAVQGLGYSAEDAGYIVDHLVLNAASGYPFAGLPRIMAIRDAPERKMPVSAMKVVKETPISLQVDGGNQIAYVAVTKAAEMALAKAKKSGICIMGMGNSWYSGRLANYVEPSARAGFVAIHCSSALPIVAPHGAARPLFGTNPICVAMPKKPDPVIVDVGTAQTMWGHVLLQAFLGIPLPEGHGIDAQGSPTTNAAEVVKGAILPIAEHRGSALSFAVQALSLMGASVVPWEEYRGWGYLFVIFDPGLLCPRERFEQDLGLLIEKMKSLPKRAGVKEILVPSERSYVARKEAETNGILFDRKVIDELKAMAKR